MRGTTAARQARQTGADVCSQDGNFNGEYKGQTKHAASRNPRAASAGMDPRPAESKQGSRGGERGTPGGHGHGRGEGMGETTTERVENEAGDTANVGITRKRTRNLRRYAASGANRITKLQNIAVQKP